MTPTDEEDPLGLLKEAKHRCEDCGTTKLDKVYKKCYLCYMKDKKNMEDE